MGHSILIGWYSSGSKRFCYKDEKQTRPNHYKGYTLPVYAVLEKGMRKDLETKVEQLQVENKRLKKAIENYGNNPAGFDWAVLEKLDEQEIELEKLKALLQNQKNFMQRLQISSWIEEAMEREATIDEALNKQSQETKEIKE